MRRKTWRKKYRTIVQTSTSTHHTPENPKGFDSVDEMLETGLIMIKARHQLSEALDESSPDPKAVKALRNNSRRITTLWHKSFTLSAENIPLVSQVSRLRINIIEREILLVMLLKHLSLINQCHDTCEDVLEPLSLKPTEQLKAIRALTETGRLIRHGLISVNTDEEAPPRWELFLDPVIAAMAMNPKQSASSGWPVNTEDALYEYMNRLANALREKADEMDNVHRGYGSKSDVYKWQRRIKHLLNGLDKTLEQHPDWLLARVRKEIHETIRLKNEQWVIFLVLLCKELGHVKVDDDLFLGMGLLRAACSKDILPHKAYNLLSASSRLRAEDWIQPCGGTDAFMSDEPNDIEESEFELTKTSLQKVGIDKNRSRKQKSDYTLLEPKVRMEDLVLNEATQSCMNQALAQSRYAKVMFQEWGLGEKISYGQGVTLMFYGPPGTGKTAGAQALAHTLEKPILIADYSRIQNCFVGQTEKNIVRIFREAAERDAVLFWDEADAMFFDRDTASRAWEVRDINVLLQELERFKGTCILATNRLTVLDKALERRISLKVKFDRPDRASRREIFHRMLPKKLPLADDVDLNTLANYDLSGGEIKNVILNATRNALVRNGSEARVCMDDFMDAIHTLKTGSWTQNTGRIIGFTA